MPQGTILDLNVACLTMALCLDSGGGEVAHHASRYSTNPYHFADASLIRWLNYSEDPIACEGYNRRTVDSDAIFAELAREMDGEG